MPLDAICLAAVREELSGRIVGMKIDKVQQPERDVIVLSLRGGAEPCRLLISTGTGDMRVHLTDYRFENPASPPMFCMLLRKFLIGARIKDIKQPPAERVLALELEAMDSMGAVTGKTLILELIGRLSNIILTDRDGIIIDCLRRIGGALSDKRAVLPGLLYRSPPQQAGKIDPLCVTDEKWQSLFESPTDSTVDIWLMEKFSALSPLICRELSWRAYGEAGFRTSSICDGGEALRREFFALVDRVKSNRFEPWVLIGEDGSPRDFSYIRIMQYESALIARLDEGFSAMLDGYYTRTAQLARLKQRTAATEKTIKTARDRLVRKLAAQGAELEKTAEREIMRECGDIIMANLHLMKKRQRVLTAQDFYSGSEKMRDIALDPMKSPQQNAAKYYKNYKKAKNAEQFLTEQIRLGERELEYLESVLEEIALVEGERDISEIRRELAETGYIKPQKQGKVKPVPSAPMRFVSSTGLQILVGKNNMQNDILTLKTAQKSDVWLHAQKIHGAHVILSCGGEAPDEISLYEAAAIAAYYSSAREAGKVPVDYTLVKHVKKPPGSRPGKVIYTDHKTIIVTAGDGTILSQR